MNPSSLLRRIALLPLRFYQNVISPAFPPCCRYAPTCSNYAIEAITTHGVIKGSILATWRILRCNPWSTGGVDHVPPHGRWTPDPWNAPDDWAGHTTVERTPMGMDETSANGYNPPPTISNEAEPHTDLPASAGRPLKTSSSTNVRSHECLN